MTSQLVFCIVSAAAGGNEELGLIADVLASNSLFFACCMLQLADMLDMLQGAFELISTQCPKAVAGMLDGMARRLSAASAARSNPNQ